MNQIDIHTKTVDDYTPVIAMDADDTLAFGHYGEFGCGPYIRVDELHAALKTEPSGDDLFDLVEQGYNHAWFRSSVNGTGRYVTVFSPSGAPLTNALHNFTNLRDAYGYVKDMEDGNN